MDGRTNTAAHNTRIRELILFSLFTALIAVGAFIRVPVPVCPFTLQLLFTTLAGALLGGKKGAAAVAVYICIGLSGVPVFTEGGGPGYIFQPTFGYLLGFAAGAWATGTIVHAGKDLSMTRLLAANFTGLLIVYAFGMAYVYVINNFYLGTALGIWPIFLYCFLLAVPGDICLCVAAAVLSKRLIPAVSWISGRTDEVHPL